jgi:hypothetical protein
MSRNSRSTALLCAAVATTVLLGGCTGTGNDPEPDASSQGGNAGAGQEGEEQGGSGAGVEQRDTQVIVEQTVSVSPDTPDDRVTIGIQSLRVEGPTMVLRYIVTPDYESLSDSDMVSLYDIWTNGGLDASGRLIDRENLKEYKVIRGGPGESWASDNVEVKTTNGTPAHAFAVFAAPEDDIDTVNIRMSEIWPEFTDVPITRP